MSQPTIGVAIGRGSSEMGLTIGVTSGVTNGRVKRDDRSVNARSGAGGMRHLVAEVMGGVPRPRLVSGTRIPEKTKI